MRGQLGRQMVVVDKEDGAVSRRAQLERELQERLARRAPAPRSPESPGGGPSAREPEAARLPFAGAIQLVCVECGSGNEGDARFCTQCGVRFNVIVRAGASRSPRGGR